MSDSSRPIAKRLLWSRLLTRSGDQAWDFAVPLMLVVGLANGVQAAALYFLAVRLGHVVLSPHVGAAVDRWPRLRALRVGIGSQVVFMVVGLALIVGLLRHGVPSQAESVAWLVPLAVAGLASNLGALVTEIAVASDIVPAAIPARDLPSVNSRMKQIDLATEVGAPLVAGLLLTIRPSGFPLLGFVLVAAWNVLSFVPEYLLVRSVLRSRPELQVKSAAFSRVRAVTLVEKMAGGWRAFLRQPLMPVMLAYAVLWLSVLSPHGILLAAFLKDAWAVPEPMIGLFRGAGAAFGLAATYLYPWLERKRGMIRATRAFIVFQAVMIAAAVGFFRAGDGHQVLFLVFILFSRIGLYGFSIGETQIRQTGIPEAERGRVNGFASALTSIATLGLYAAGAVFARPDQFRILVFGSGTAVAFAAAIYAGWTVSQAGRRADPDESG